MNEEIRGAAVVSEPVIVACMPNTTVAQAGEGVGSAADAGSLNVSVYVTNPSWGVGMVGVITELALGEAKMMIEGLISLGTVVTFAINDFKFDGHILFCERRGQQYEVHVSIDDSDESGLRRTPRFPVNIAGRVSAASLESPVAATIVDISGDGLGLDLPVPLQVQSIVSIESESNVAFGVVRYSREVSPGRVRAGVQLHHIIRRGQAPEPAAARGRTGFMARVGARFTVARRSPHPAV